MKKLITLAKDLDFNSEIEYFEYLESSWINGNFNQCKELFFKMRKFDRKVFISWLNSNKDFIDAKMFNFYFNLL